MNIKAPIEEQIDCFKQDYIKLLDKFLALDIISKNPFELTDSQIEEIYNSRSASMSHVFELSSFSENCFALILKNEGYRDLEYNGNDFRVGILSNNVKSFDFNYSNFNYPFVISAPQPCWVKVFSNYKYGMIISLKDGEFQIKQINPNDFFQSDNFIGNKYILEYGIPCKNVRFGNYALIPRIADYNGLNMTDQLFGMRVSLLRTKYFLIKYLLEFPGVLAPTYYHNISILPKLHIFFSYIPEIFNSYKKSLEDKLKICEGFLLKNNIPFESFD